MGFTKNIVLKYLNPLNNLKITFVIYVKQKMRRIYQRTVYIQALLQERCVCIGITFLSPEYGGKIFLRNLGTYLEVHMTLQLRRPPKHKAAAHIHLTIRLTSKKLQQNLKGIKNSRKTCFLLYRTQKR
jgi:hypothetical protein